MITLPMVIISLVTACAIVSVTYALISPGEPDRVMSEALSNAGMMVGGIVALGLGIMLVGWIFG